jgi:uncharacterized protein YbjT (DUF2867 family)
MQTAKTIFITGATGNQGGAVARNLLKNGFNVKALTRNASSVAAQRLKEINAEVIQGNLDDPASYEQHLKGVDAIFCVLVFSKGIKKEIQQGIALADMAKENRVQHFLYSSVIGADKHTGIPHWESKFKIENHIKQTGLSYTIIRPSSLYENLLIPQVRSGLLKGKLVFPVQKNRVQQYISSEDIGKISTAIFLDPVKYFGKTLTVAAEQMDGAQVAAIFSKVWGKEIKYQQLPGIITRLAMGGDLYKMFRWINNNDAAFVKDIGALREEFPGMLNLEKWIREYFK